jgi:hypothetical protein
MPRLRAVFVAALACAPLLACFAGYDSRWGEQKRAQSRAAASAGPATIEAGSAKAPTAAAHVFRVRIWASRSYVAQTLDWKAHVRALVDDVNQVLPGAIDARLDVESLDSWDAAPKEDGTDAAMSALIESDPGEGVDAVVAMIGGVPKFTRDFHELGLGEVFGKHMVVRGTTSIDDQELIDNRFDQLDESERTRLRREYRRHRELAVFLHEYAHTLGAIHEATSLTLMAPSYNRKASTFAPETLELMRVTVAHLPVKDADAARSLATEQLAVYEKTKAEPWVTEEREAMTARLRAIAPPSTRASASASSVAVDPALSPDDRATWTRALDARAKGDLAKAWEIATPLFATYPKVRSVQDLRCKLAMRQGFSVDRMKKECEPLLQLEGGK